MKHRACWQTVQAGAFLVAVLGITFFSVLFENRTLASVQTVGVLGIGPFGYQGEYPHWGLIDPGGSTWTPRPSMVVAHQQLASGQVPLWNPFIGIGQPLAAAFDTNVFNPIRALLHCDPSPLMWDLFMLLRLWLAGFFTYLFLRAIAASQLGSLFSAVIFMLTGYFIWGIDMHHLDAEIMLPFMVLCFEKMIRSGGALKWGLACSLGVVLLLAGGQPQAVFLILGFGAVYFGVRLLSIPETRRPTVFFKHWARLGFFSALGFAFCAPLLLPFFEFWKLSFNNHDPRPGFLLGINANPYLSDCVSFITPYFFGLPHFSWMDDYDGHLRGIGYFGVTAALFALAAFFGVASKPRALRLGSAARVFRFRVEPVCPAMRQCSPRSDSSQNAHSRDAKPERTTTGALRDIEKTGQRALILFLSAVLVLLFCKYYGLPLVNRLGELPIANMVNFRKYPGPLLAFCVAVLAGIGLDQIAGGQARIRALKNAAFLLILVMTAAFCYHFNLMMSRSEAPRVFGILAWMRDHRLVEPPVVNLVLWQVLVTLALMGVVLLWAGLFHRGKLLSGKSLQILVLLLAVFELSFYVPNPGFSKGRNERADMLGKAPYIDFLSAHLGHQRVVGNDYVLYPIFGSAFGISDIRVMEGLVPKRYLEYVTDNFRMPNPPDRFTGEQGFDFRDQRTLRAMSLLGVKYILTRTDIIGSYYVEDILSRGAIIQAPGQPTGNWINASSLSIDGVSKPTLYAHPPSRIDYPLRVPAGASWDFSIALMPGAWDHPQGDGVLFEITVREGDRRETLFSHYLDPKHRMEDRRWVDASLDLSAYEGKDIILELVTLPGRDGGTDAAFDWSAWGEPRLTAAGQEPQQQALSLVYDQEIKIYENKDAFPRAFVVHDYEVLAGKDEILARLKDPRFPLRDKIILEKEISPPLRAVLDRARAQVATATASRAKIQNYSAQRVELQADMTSPGFLVLSDLCYPGWQAYVDDEAVETFQADSLFRAVFLEEGAHRVSFVYEPRSFRLGVMIAAGAAVLTLLLVGVALVRRRTRAIGAQDPAPASDDPSLT